VREQVAHGDSRSILAAPFRNMPRDRIVEREHAALELLHHEGRCRYNFGERGEVEDRVVGRRRGVRVVRQAAERLTPEHLGRGANLDDRRGKGSFGDRLLEHALRGVEADPGSRTPGSRQDPANAPRPIAER
jgi:hypothetical protein